uniref:Uncharacterized protein n=1 Tax=Oryza barthii TaxID=65489 RepID=A0A0D3GWR4_9ORYZ
MPPAVLCRRRPTKKLPWELYAFHGDVRVTLNPDVKPFALRTPRLDAYSGQSLIIPSTSTTRRTLALGFLDHTTSSIGIQGADVDPDGYAEAAGNLKAQVV